MSERPRLKREDDRRKPRKGEIAVMLVATAFTVALVGYMTWQAVAVPDGGPPRAEVDATETLPNGDVLVVVVIHHDGRTGLREVEVEVDCGDPPPALSFQNVPAHSRRSGTVLCPPGTEAPKASVSWFIEA